jgi:hypothetical protein
MGLESYIAHALVWFEISDIFSATTEIIEIREILNPDIVVAFA